MFLKPLGLEKNTITKELLPLSRQPLSTIDQLGARGGVESGRLGLLWTQALLVKAHFGQPRPPMARSLYSAMRGAFSNQAWPSRWLQQTSHVDSGQETLPPARSGKCRETCSCCPEPSRRVIHVGSSSLPAPHPLCPCGLACPCPPSLLPMSALQPPLGKGSSLGAQLSALIASEGRSLCGCGRKPFRSPCPHAENRPSHDHMLCPFRLSPDRPRSFVTSPFSSAEAEALE